MYRLVEAELAFQLLDEFRVQPLGAAIFSGDVGASGGGAGPAPGTGFAPAAA